jgi:hypothetical protein
MPIRISTETTRRKPQRVSKRGHPPGEFGNSNKLADRLSEYGVSCVASTTFPLGHPNTCATHIAPATNWQTWRLPKSSQLRGIVTARRKGRQLRPRRSNQTRHVAVGKARTLRRSLDPGTLWGSDSLVRLLWDYAHSLHRRLTLTGRGDICDRVEPLRMGNHSRLRAPVCGSACCGEGWARAALDSCQ